MSYENPTDIERELYESIEKVNTELSTLRCLVTGLCQHIKTVSGQEALDAVIASALEEVKICEHFYVPKADSYLLPKYANGFALKR